MAGSPGGQGLSGPEGNGPDGTSLVVPEPAATAPRLPSFTPRPPAGAAAGPGQDAPERQVQPVPCQPTQASQPSQPSPSQLYEPTRTAPPARGGQGAPPAGSSGGSGSGGYPQQVVRHGPGVPAPAPGRGGQPAPTAEEVWRTGLPSATRRPRPLRRVAGTALSVVLLAASGVVIYQRLHHGPFGVTGTAITGQVKDGCTVDVTGRIGTTGAAGIVSYQWVFQPQSAPPRPLSQSAAAGQPAVWVTAAVEGQGHGNNAETVTLQVLGPGHGSASARVVLSC
jgi:hypothetical protein